jgi:hypothetical protein
VPASASLQQVAADVSSAYQATVAGVLPLSEEIVSNASSGLFSQTSPDHPWSMTLKSVAQQLCS